MKRGWLVGIVLAVALITVPLAGTAAPQYAEVRGRLTCPRSAARGGAIRVSGSGFASGSVVAFRFDRRPARPPSTVADGSGVVTTPVNVPATAGRGAHRITASALSSDGDLLVLRCNVVVRFKPRRS